MVQPFAVGLSLEWKLRLRATVATAWGQIIEASGSSGKEVSGCTRLNVATQIVPKGSRGYTWDKED